MGHLSNLSAHLATKLCRVRITPFNGLQETGAGQTRDLQSLLLARGLVGLVAALKAWGSGEGESRKKEWGAGRVA
jgi:hypothetical protein